MLSANKAIKLLGIPRKQFAQDIKEGKINQYDGCVLLEDLKEVYPDSFDECRTKTLYEIIKNNASNYRDVDADNLDPKKLLRQIKRLEAQVEQLQQELELQKNK